MDNPNINRLIMFLILFGGLGIFAFGYHYGQPDIVKWIVCGVGIGFTVVSVIWGVKKVRCPYCNGLLRLKIWYDVKCPYCGRDVNN